MYMVVTTPTDDALQEHHFEESQTGMRNRLKQLRALLNVFDPHFYQFLSEWVGEGGREGGRERRREGGRKGEREGKGEREREGGRERNGEGGREGKGEGGREREREREGGLETRKRKRNKEQREREKRGGEREREIYCKLFFLFFLLSSENKEVNNLYFCFRWLLIHFKREFDYPVLMRLWEVHKTQK